MNIFLTAILLAVPFSPPPLQVTSNPPSLRINSKQPTLLVFYTAKWCRACKQQYPMVRKLAGEGYPINYIDVDDPKWSKHIKRFPYTVLPHWLMVKDRKAWQVRRGAVSEVTIRQWFGEAGLPTPRARAPARAYTPASKVVVCQPYIPPVTRQMPVRRAPVASYGGFRGLRGLPSCGNPGCPMCPRVW